MREMLIVILNECEGSVPVVRKSVKCHSEQEQRRLSDYLLLHKVFNTKRNLKKIRTYDKIMRSISAVLSVVLAGIGEETEETR